MKMITLFIPFLLFANHIHWLGDYNRAHQKAIYEKKPLMVYLIKENCKLCKEIVLKSFTNKDYIDRLNSKFISVIVNYNQQRDYPNELYYSNNFPTLFFVDEKTETFLTTPLKKEQINPKNIERFLDER